MKGATSEYAAPDGSDLAAVFAPEPQRWGLRGDPHVWAAMRELLAGQPVPANPSAVRAVFVDAFRQLIRVDLDTDESEAVYREEFSHGGMSSGQVYLPWWRTTGIPLLVNRAMKRMPDANLIRIAAKSLGVTPGKLSDSIRILPGDSALYAWTSRRGGAAVIVGADGTALLANPSVSFDDHLAAFRSGRRTDPKPLEKG